MFVAMPQALPHIGGANEHSSSISSKVWTEVQREGNEETVKCQERCNVPLCVRRRGRRAGFDSRAESKSDQHRAQNAKFADASLMRRQRRPCPIIVAMHRNFGKQEIVLAGLHTLFPFYEIFAKTRIRPITRHSRILRKSKAARAAQVCEYSLLREATWWSISKLLRGLATFISYFFARFGTPQSCWTPSRS